MAINTTENVKDKPTFERDAQRNGVAINIYHTYNGLFYDSEFMEVMLNNK